jgi:hypothetical protein
MNRRLSHYLNRRVFVAISDLWAIFGYGLMVGAIGGLACAIAALSMAP